MSKISTENTKGGIPVFSPEGFLFMPLTNGVQCFVNKEKFPYLAKISFENSAVNNTQSNVIINSTTATTTNSFAVGARLYLLQW